MSIDSFGQKDVSLTVFFNTGRVFADLMSDGRLFHALGPACAKARSPNDVVVRGMMRSPTAANRKQRLGSELCVATISVASSGKLNFFAPWPPSRVPALVVA